MENTPKNEISTQAIVSLDGTRIRQLRESKKLTQLYVANVVGVTTDTISRWENNRYPTVKRENAEKLAAALQVELEAVLLQQEEEQVPPEVPVPPSRSRKRPLVYLAGLVIVVAGLGAYAFIARPRAEVTAVRTLPSYSAPGTLVPVQVEILRQGDAAQGMVVKERLPRGWKVVKATPGQAAGQAAEEEVKWFIPPGKESVTIAYTAVVPAPAAATVEARFAGKVVVGTDGGTTTEPVGGDGSTKVAEKHWADRNGDGVIDDNEIMPAYYVTEQMKGLGLDWETIEAIWNSNGYRWDAASGRFAPLR